MSRFRVEFNTTEYVYVIAQGVSDAYWMAKTYENSTRIIEDIEVIERIK
jgi:hypothetical protein